MPDSVSQGARGGRSRQRGQATVETVGIIVAIALLLAATGAWLSGGISLPRPPDLIGSIARILGGAGAPAAPRPGIDEPGPGGFVRADHANILPPRADPPLGRPVRWVGARLEPAVGFAWSGTTFVPALAVAFGDGFVDRLRERAVAIRDDPAALLRAIRDLQQAPEEMLRDLPGPVRIWRYVKDVRALGPREGAFRVSRDGGGWTADVVVEVGTRRAGRVLRGPRGRTSPRNESPRPPRGDEPRLVFGGDGPRVLR